MERQGDCFHASYSGPSAMFERGGEVMTLLKALAGALLRAIEAQERELQRRLSANEALGLAQEALLELGYGPEEFEEEKEKEKED